MEEMGQDHRPPPQVKPLVTEVNAKSELPPLFKKPKKDLEDQDGPTPHFPGPLFLAVHRVATATPPSRPNVSDLRVSVGDGPAESAPTSASLYDRDWVYPAFLGHHPAKSTGVSLKASKSLNLTGRSRPIDQGSRRVVLEKKLLDVENNNKEIRMESSKVIEKMSGSGSA